MVYNGLKKLCGFMFPPTCVLCGGDGIENRDLCGACASQLPMIDTHCHRCGVPLSMASEEKILCGHCLQQPPYFDCVLSPFRYEQPVNWLIQRFKYNASLSHARVLAGLLCDYLERILPELPEAIVPVPLHNKRLQSRGFN
jgi:predicted amidophosphoribosyltransferase